MNELYPQLLSFTFYQQETNLMMPGPNNLGKELTYWFTLGQVLPLNQSTVVREVLVETTTNTEEGSGHFRYAGRVSEQIIP